ncbi:hypothetical protein AQY21_16095 [Paracoccus sp. MKU1]|nr:hypothetical protein AQY21_16095 [Paracoccus sp. MKU1]
MTGDNADPQTPWRMTPLRVAVIMVCFLLNAIDGMDIVIMSYIAPVLRQEWQLSPEALGVVFSASLAGMAAGGLLVAPLADRLGRRPVILCVLAVITLSMLASSQARNITELAILRGVIGVSVGAFLACVAAIAADFAPAGKKALFVAIAVSGYPFGAVMTGLSSAHFMHLYGWHGMLIGASIVSAIAFPIVLLVLPESIDFLKSAQPRDALPRLNRILQRLGEPVLKALPPKPQKTERASVAALLAQGRTIPTLALWTSIILVFMTFYFLVSWITQLSVQAGLPLESAIYAGAVFNLGGFFGTLSIGFLGLRYGLQKVTFLALCMGAVVVAVFGWVNTSLVLTLVLAFCAGFLTNGGFNGFYGLSAVLYPVEIRSTGIGWAMGVGRLGAVAGPLAGGILIGMGLETPVLMMVFAVPLVLSGLGALWVRERGRAGVIGTATSVAVPVK